MAKQSIIVELDDETIRYLNVLGRPTEVLAYMARSAAHGVRRPGLASRDQTNESLRVERNTSDTRIAGERDTDEEEADEVVRIARRRADRVVQAARDAADRERRPNSTATEASAESARIALDHERSNADAVLRYERSERRGTKEGFLTVEREATDKDLSGERDDADKLIVDQREANERMVSATIRAQELRDEAEAAKERAEKGERELHVVAQFREMFIGILGHDLRTPLMAIIMSAGGLIQRGHLDEQEAAAAARIIRVGQRMARMIAQLLDLTRTRLGGGFPIEPHPTDLREVCRNVVGEFEATIHVEVEGDLTGTWDQDRLVEALSNLAGNAIEWSAPGTVVIVKAHADDAGVVVGISNQGDPIPADVLPFIFEPFRRGQRRAKSAAGNLGLGLYIAHQIVTAHGGTLDARSAEGTTTFEMRLPRGPLQVAPS